MSEFEAGAIVTGWLLGAFAVGLLVGYMLWRRQREKLLNGWEAALDELDEPIRVVVTDNRGGQIQVTTGLIPDWDRTVKVRLKTLSPRTWRNWHS